jgi:hypothetical protein
MFAINIDFQIFFLSYCQKNHVTLKNALLPFFVEEKENILNLGNHLNGFWAVCYKKFNFIFLPPLKRTEYLHDVSCSLRNIFLRFYALYFSSAQ